MMEKTSAQKLVHDTLQGSFNKERFVYLVKNLLNRIEESPFIYQGKYIFDDFADSIQSVERLGKYTDPEGKLIDILVVRLKKETSLERARTKQRNFVAKYLKGSRGGALKDAALVAFVSPNEDDWRFSLVKMEYKFDGRGKIREEFTPARRYSFLVGKHENTHTAQSCLIPCLLNDEANPTLKDLEDAFSVEKVTKEFFEKYRELFLKLKESLDEILKIDEKVREDFKTKNIDTTDFAKKLLGQIVFLYFLQKKGWFGVKRNQEWGRGSKRFLRELFEKRHGEYKNFYNDILEPLFYEALRLERPGDYYSRFDCRIPFLNGGLFDPINDYDWWNTDIFFPKEIFSNNRNTKEGDIGDGILDVFDRYNFTVKEDEPLEKEVAIDPEMLGKVFENLLEVKDRKSKGTYYTPREIVHYMCQEVLANYLAAELQGKVSKDDINALMTYGESAVEHDIRVINKGHETYRYSFKLPESVRKNAKLIDEALASIRVCDPAVGSGAFLVGMMNEIIRTRNALTPYIVEDGNRSPYNFKRHTIQNCLYGVDIDPGAVEIAKLRLWLSLIVDEEEREKIQPLPNLDYKILQGNSLLGVKKDLFNQPLFAELEELKPLYFDETSASKKQKYKKQIDELISNITKGHMEFDFEAYFSEVFHRKSGFDVVIANPPYVDSEEMAKSMPDFRKKISASYDSAKGNWDLYIPFWELGFKLLSSNGNAVFITPNKWLSIGYGEKLRALLDESVYRVGNCNQVKVFEAGNSPVVVFASKATSNDNINIDVFAEDYSISEIVKTSKDILSQENWGLLLSKHIKLLLKILNVPQKVQDNYFGENPCTVSEAYKIKSLIKDLKEASKYNPNLYFKFINTGTIDAYIALWGEKATTYLKDKYLFPVIKKEEFLKAFPRRYSQMNSMKIVISGIRHFECLFDKVGEIIAGKSTVILKSKNNGDYEVILGILNSEIISFYIKESYGTLGISGGINFTTNLVESLPIPKIDDSSKKDITKIVKKIIGKADLKSTSLSEKQLHEYKKQIDQIVYKLYDLTPEEIEIVEGSQN